MYMAYTTNPNLPRVRMDAVRLVRSGWSTRKVARHLGFNQASYERPHMVLEMKTPMEVLT